MVNLFTHTWRLCSDHDMSTITVPLSTVMRVVSSTALSPRLALVLYPRPKESEQFNIVLRFTWPRVTFVQQIDLYKVGALSLNLHFSSKIQRMISYGLFTSHLANKGSKFVYDTYLNSGDFFASDQCEQAIYKTKNTLPHDKVILIKLLFSSLLRFY